MSDEHVIRLDMSGYPERFRGFDEATASSPSLLERAERAEAEVERLRGALAEAVALLAVIKADQWPAWDGQRRALLAALDSPEVPR